MKTVEVNHLFQEPPKRGSVALCGFVKETNRGFVKKYATCNDCVAVALNVKRIKGLTR